MLPGAHTVEEKIKKGKIAMIFMGDFKHQWWELDDEPTSELLASCIQLIRRLKLRFPTITKLGGHREFRPGTVCPGTILYAQLPDMCQQWGLRKP